MASRRILDWFFCGYCCLHIFSSFLFNSQGVFPTWMFPDWLKGMRKSYLSYYRDPFLADTSSFPWFMAICVVEFTLEIPYFFCATYAYYKGASTCPWIRVPSLLYSVHTATAVLGILFTVCLDDFSRYPVSGPRDFHERTRLFFVYFPFLFICVLIIMDTCFSSAYKKERGKVD